MIDTRSIDLEEIADAMKKAKTTAEREHYEKIMWRILGESQPIRALRANLLMAVRASDYKAVKRIQLHIQHIRYEETSGASWGDNKGNRNVN